MAQEKKSQEEVIEAAVAKERERCLAICRLWPDNLMAKEIYRRIARGDQ